MKKLLSCVFAGMLVLQGTQNNVFAIDSGRIQVGSASVSAGEIFTLPITIEENPGIAAFSLNLSYDASKLELLGVGDGGILGTSTFVSGDNLTKIPYILNWDDLSAENNSRTGTVATLSFKAKDGAAGNTEVSVSVNQKSTYNINLEEVAFETVSGTVSITVDEDAPAIIADTVSGYTGDTVDVPIRIQNNPGIAALSLNVSYDRTKLKLLDAKDGEILGSSAFLASNDPTRIPFILNWDDLSTENNTGNGIVAALKFEVLAAEGDAAVGITVNQRSTYDVDLEEVVFAVTNGAVQIDKPGTTTTLTSTTTNTTTTITEITAASTQSTTTTVSETTVAHLNYAAIVIDTVSGYTGDTVDVPIRIQNNPGIAALSLNVSCDSSKLKLLGAEDGKILGSSTFIASDDLARIPYILNWDDLSSANNSGNGIVATLKFEVLAAEGNAAVEITVNQRSTYNVDLEEVVFAVTNGAVQIGKPQNGDMNGDGEITVADAVLLARFVTEDDTLTEEQVDGILNEKPDLDEDGLVTVLDIRAILKKLENE